MVMWSCHFARGNAAGLGDFGVGAGLVLVPLPSAPPAAIDRRRHQLNLRAGRAHPSTPY